jgi:hypothetical protein
MSITVVKQYFLTCNICGRETKDLTYKRAHEHMKEHFLLKHKNQKYQVVESFGYSS